MVNLAKCKQFHHYANQSLNNWRTKLHFLTKGKYIFTFYYESLDDALEEGTESIKTIVNPKVANLIEEIKTANRYTPKQRKLRLDSYSKRKIVSRKATTLAEIKESTFIKYL
jgi:hypothetical protein